MGGSQSTPKITAQDRALLDFDATNLRPSGNFFPISQIHITLDGEHEIAKQQLPARHKDRALIALRRLSTIEFSLVEVSVLHGLKQGNAVLKETHKELNGTAEARKYQRALIIISGNRPLLMNSLSLDENAQETKHRSRSCLTLPLASLTQL
ncbi:hypothetical protein H4582DRAFT_2022830 [Lactarius indigo]|nr:hypothetical protein H4582DRAFT_2022830 [Lactarius indigo]